MPNSLDKDVLNNNAIERTVYIYISVYIFFFVILTWIRGYTVIKFCFLKRLGGFVSASRMNFPSVDGRHDRFGVSN